MDISNTIGSCPSIGTTHAIGFVESLPSIPPCGATHVPPPWSFVMSTPIISASAARQAYPPNLPTSLHRETATELMSVCFAFSIANSTARVAITGPNPQCPSNAAMDADSCSVSVGAPGWIKPASNSRTYFGRWITPCESCPTRLASTMERVTISASAAGTFNLWKTLRQIVVSSSAVKFGIARLLHRPSECGF